MSSQDKNSINKLIETYSRRVQLLNERLATEGITADPSISIEIESIEAKLSELRLELQRVDAQNEDIPSQEKTTESQLAFPENKQLDISHQAIITSAFPLNGNTHVVYTCRGLLEDPPFECPGKGDVLQNTLVVPAHIPIDELETYGLCLAWYGHQIIGKQEKSVRNSIICSEAMLNHEITNDLDTLFKGGEIDEVFLNNLIVIGENSFSNYLFYLISYHLPWRHFVTEMTEKPVWINLQHHRFWVKAIFTDRLKNRIADEDLLQIQIEAINWGLITFAPNPFAPDKWILFLVGCRRPGQYLLLSWLRDHAAYECLSSLASYRKKNDGAFFQIAIKGRPSHPIERGQISREWNFDVVKDISTTEPTPFFTAQIQKNSSRAKWGEVISDLSLSAAISDTNNIIEQITQTLPNSLKGLLGEEQQNPNIGLHVTLYEFLHTRGSRDYGFLKGLINGEDQFLYELKDAFKSYPQIHLRLRQTRLTRYSLQILIDIYGDMKMYFGTRRYWDEAKPSVMSVMDLVIEGCNRAKATLSKEKQSRFNIDRAPMPLHLTLLRFRSDTTTDEQRSDAQKWAEKYRRRIWGTIENSSVVLTVASKYPFLDIRSEKIL